MAALITRDVRRHLKQPNKPVLLGVDLQNAKEEAFCVMVCDGLSVASAYVRAGFTSKASNAALTLFHKPHIQARAHAILEARRTQGVVTLPEVTSMLQRVFAGALHDAEYSAAHNAAFSLARLYGLVTDRSTLEVIRRPSRDPDAPSEQALASWVETLPGLTGPGPEASGQGPQASGQGPSGSPSGGPLRDAPAVLLELEAIKPSNINWLEAGPSGPGPSDLKFSNDINGFPTTPHRPENGAPVGPVTEPPHECARAELLGTTPVGGSEKGAPLQNGQVPVLTGEFPPAEDLF
jgi:hypothetical protein